MKKIASIILAFLVTLCFWGCNNEVKTANAKFYYIEADPQYHAGTSVIQAEDRTISVPLSELEQIINEYLDGPETSRFVSPFPNGIKLVSIQPGKEQVEVVLNDELANLTGVDLAVACACLSATLLEITQSESIQIRAETIPIGPQGFIVMDMQSIQLLDR